MALIGATVWVAAKSTGGLARAWHFVLIAAHTIPLIAVALFTASTPEMTLGTVLISLGIHTVGIGAELYAGSLRDEG